MNLEFDSETQYLIGQASDVLASVLPIARLREPMPVWGAVVEAGWGTLGDSFAAGEIDFATIVGIAREAGRQVFGEQFTTSAFLVPALLHGASGPDADELRARLSVRAAVLLGDGTPSAETNAPTSGRCFGLDGDQVEVLRLRTVGAELVVEFADDATTSITRTADLSFGVGDVSVDGGTWRSVTLDVDGAGLQDLLDRAMLVHAAALVGCTEQILSITRDYTLDRVQFGVAIASFQAVKHDLADVLAAVEVAWAAILTACADDGASSRRLVARVLCINAATLAATAGAQFHGGIGFTAESDLHFYLKSVLDASMRFRTRDELAAQITTQFLEETCSR